MIPGLVQEAAGFLAVFCGSPDSCGWVGRSEPDYW